MRDHYQTYLIRGWQPSDRRLAAAVIQQVLAEYDLGWEPQGADRDVMEVEAAYLVTGGEFWVVEEQGQVVGTAAYYPLISEPSAPCGVEIRKMYLLPHVRGQGLGRYLLNGLEQQIRQRGFHHIRLETASVLSAAIDLYERSGYLPVTNIETPRCDRAYIKWLEPEAATLGSGKRHKRIRNNAP